MTWTYSGDPETSPKDRVRFLMGLTDTNNQRLTDEEIEHLIDEADGDAYLAASFGATQLAGRYSSYVSVSGDGLSWSGGDLSSKWYELADRLLAMRRRKLRAAPPYAGGLSKRERELDDNDEDLPAPAFRSRMHDNPRDYGQWDRRVDEWN